jgi:hypothetical protein
MADGLAVDTFDLDLADIFGLDSFTFDDSASEFIAPPENNSVAQDGESNHDAFSSSRILSIEFDMDLPLFVPFPSSPTLNCTRAFQAQAPPDNMACLVEDAVVSNIRTNTHDEQVQSATPVRRIATKIDHPLPIIQAAHKPRW